MEKDKPKRDRAKKRKKDEAKTQTVKLEGEFLIIQFDSPGSAEFGSLRECSANQLLSVVGYFDEIARLEIAAAKIRELQIAAAKAKADADLKPKILVPKAGLGIKQ